MASYIELEEETIVDCIRKAMEGLSTNISFEELTKEQVQCTVNVIEQRDTFLMLPTGAGKSFPFQIVARVAKELNRLNGNYFTKNPIVLVVSPLLSLMGNHVREMAAMGISAASLNSSKDDDILKGAFEVVLGSPEAWLNLPKWREMLRSSEYQKRVFCIVTDEVHCIPKW